MRLLMGSFLFMTSLAASAGGVGVGLSHPGGRFFYGGGIGASFGEVDVVSVTPNIGMFLNENASIGVSLAYVYRNDSRAGRDITTQDYGSSVFGRYFLTPRFFLETDLEYLNSEIARLDGSTIRKDFNTTFVGGGIRSPLGANASAYLSILYNLDQGDADSPYSEPVSIRGGIGVGF